MIPNPERRKGSGPLLGARYPGESGPFGEYGAADGQDDDDQPPDLDPVGAVNNRVAQLVAQARARRVRQKAQRRRQQAARDIGLAARHAAKLRRLDDGQEPDSTT